jgi:hypothetical protein
MSKRNRAEKEEGRLEGLLVPDNISPRVTSNSTTRTTRSSCGAGTYRPRLSKKSLAALLLIAGAVINNYFSTRINIAIITNGATSSALPPPHYDAALAEERHQQSLLIQIKAKKILASGIDGQKPPNTLGAFIHVGKTAGSTLSKFLRNGCHSFAGPKPCKFSSIANNAISILTTYYHAEVEHDRLFEIDAKKPYDFLIWTVRDPLARTISAFIYNHPFNRVVQVEHKIRTKRNLHFDIVYPIFMPCFPTLEDYAQGLENFSAFELNNQTVFKGEGNCTNRAKASLYVSKQQDIPNHVQICHIYTNLRRLSQNIADAFSRPLFAIRTEFIWKDWENTNLFFGDDTNSNFTNIASLKNSSAVEYPVKNIISESGRKNMCLALEDEYRVYFEMLNAALNLSEDDVKDSLKIARKNCPWLTIFDEVI